MATTREILTDALVELGVYSIAQIPAAADLQVVLGRLNRLLDSWNAQGWAVYCQTFSTFTLIPSQQIVTIGPTAATPDWVVTQRPVEILGAAVVLDSVSPSVNQPINIRDAQWWQGLTVPGVSTEFPTDLYYEPAWPLGRVHLWPVPTTAYGLQLQLRLVLAELALDDEFSLPPGYKDAIILTVAEQSARAFGRQVDASLRLDAQNARSVVFAVNDETPQLATSDFGMPKARRSAWNYLTGMPC
jgi:hypothetical protein